MTNHIPAISNIVDNVKRNPEELAKFNTQLNDQLHEQRNQNEMLVQRLQTEELKSRLLKMKLERAQEELLAIEILVNQQADDLAVLKNAKENA